MSGSEFEREMWISEMWISEMNSGDSSMDIVSERTVE